MLTDVHHMPGLPCAMQVLAKEGPSAWLPALRAIPRRLRTMYLHAVQSYLWNAAASQRVLQSQQRQQQVQSDHARDHGAANTPPAHGLAHTAAIDVAQGGNQEVAEQGVALAVQAGDLVLPGSPWPDGHFGADGPAITEPQPGGASKNADDAVQHNGEASSAAASNGDHGNRSKKRKRDRRTGASGRSERMMCVTAADVAAQRYSAEEIVLPLPGASCLPGRHDATAPAATNGAARALTNNAHTSTTSQQDTAERNEAAGAAEQAGAAPPAGAAESRENGLVWGLYERLAAEHGIPLAATPHGVPEFSLGSLSGAPAHTRAARLQCSVSRTMGRVVQVTCVRHGSESL